MKGRMGGTPCEWPTLATNIRENHLPSTGKTQGLPLKEVDNSL